jgi:hypothetical protein
MRLPKSIPTFVFGLSIGLLIGVGFFLFKIDDIFKSMRDSTKEQITIVEQPVKNVKEEEEGKKDKERFKIHLGKNTKVNYKEVDSLIKNDNNLNVATEELVSVKSVKVIKLGESETQDTASAKLAGVENKPNSSLYFIEFWKTPLNSKGYRFTKNKLMLYGFVDFSDILIYELDSDFYLKSSEQVYKITAGSDFRKLEKVVDNDVLAKMN